MATHLSVNVNKVATLRNTRHNGIPSVVRAAQLALDAGAAGITVHPRPDQRHIRPHDVEDISRLLMRYPRAELNIEGNPFHGLLDYARRFRPHQCTLVPDAAEAFTSNQGYDLANEGEPLRAVIREMKSLGCRVSLFMDAIPERMTLAPAFGPDRVELYTEPYANASTVTPSAEAVQPYARAAAEAQRLGLGVNAGHDLSLHNLPFFLTHVRGVSEVSIGHALIAEALEYGIPETVRRYLAICATG
ncbi:MAG: pyridoxine 5'-phosphate synthase [Myxococcota bacterium]